MTLSAKQIQDRCDLYELHAKHLPPGPDQAVAMLGMMACAGASWRRFRDMPEEWGWPRAVCPRMPPEAVSRTLRTQN